MSKWALVTGATSGIGAAFAHQLGTEGSNVVLVARDQERLDTVASQLRALRVEVQTLSADLATDQGISAVETRLTSTEEPVELLINNAGFGLSGAFVGSDIADHERMLRVNVMAVVRLTHAALGVMTQRKHGGVLNVSSVAAYTPALRPSSTYAASKAFVTAFTEGLTPTLARDGVTVSAVCPGFVRSEFHTRAGINMTKLPNFLWLEPSAVARAALKGHRAGQAITVPGAQYKAIVVGVRILPASIAHRVARVISRRAG